MIHSNNNGWIPCGEQLPLARTRVLITTIYGDVIEASRIKDNKFDRFGQEVIGTHWQPLPEAALN